MMSWMDLIVVDRATAVSPWLGDDFEPSGELDDVESLGLGQFLAPLAEAIQRFGGLGRHIGLVAMGTTDHRHFIHQKLIVPRTAHLSLCSAAVRHPYRSSRKS